MAPQIYVASLTDYNNGVLHGVWVDMTQDLDDIWQQVNDMLAKSPTVKSGRLAGPAEEWGIHDYEGFEGIKLDEFESLDRVAEIATMIAEHGPAFAAYVSNEGMEYATAEGFDEAFCGIWPSEADYAQELAREIGEEIPDGWPFSCIDWERAWNELRLGGDNWSHYLGSGDYAIFRC